MYFLIILKQAGKEVDQGLESAGWDYIFMPLCIKTALDAQLYIFLAKVLNKRRSIFKSTKFETHCIVFKGNKFYISQAYLLIKTSCRM